MNETKRDALIEKANTAIRQDDLPFFKKCVDDGFALHLKCTCCGWTSFNASAWRGSLDICKYLVEEHKMDIYEKDLDGCSPYSDAVDRGHTEVAEYFESIKAKEYVSVNPSKYIHHVKSPLTDILKYLD